MFMDGHLNRWHISSLNFAATQPFEKEISYMSINYNFKSNLPLESGFDSLGAESDDPESGFVPLERGFDYRESRPAFGRVALTLFEFEGKIHVPGYRSPSRLSHPPSR